MNKLFLLLVFCSPLLSLLASPDENAVCDVLASSSANDAEAKARIATPQASQVFVQLEELYKGSDAQRRLDEQIRRYREKAKKNALSFGRDYVKAEKQKFRIPVGFRNGEAITLKYGERIEPSMIRDIRPKALDERSRSLKIEEGAHGITFARDWDERFRAYDPYTGWSCRYHSSGKLAVVRYWRDGKLKGPFAQWNKTGKKELEGYYWDGWEDGLWTRWFENGKKQHEGRFNIGDPDGVFITYNDDGTVNKRVNFKNGQLIKP